MPWRFLGYIIISVVFLFFIGFNLDNRCDISFGFTVLTGTPVYFTVFGSFMLGLICAIPVMISARFKKPKKQPGKKRGKRGELKETLEDSPHANDGTYGID